MGVLGPVGAGLGIVSTIADLFGGWKAKKEQEELERKQRALQIVAQLSRNSEQAGRRWGY
jgi:hypothetical protein